MKTIEELNPLQRGAPPPETVSSLAAALYYLAALERLGPFHRFTYCATGNDLFERLQEYQRAQGHHCVGPQRKTRKKSTRGTNEYSIYYT